MRVGFIPDGIVKDLPGGVSVSKVFSLKVLHYSTQPLDHYNPFLSCFRKHFRGVFLKGSTRIVGDIRIGIGYGRMDGS